MWLSWNGKYEVSDAGEIRHKIRKAILKPFVGHHGYGFVSVNVDGKQTNPLVHRMIATCFLPAPTDVKCVVDHIDRDKLNNAASNLRWVSRQENNYNSDINLNGRIDKVSGLPSHVFYHKTRQCYYVQLWRRDVRYIQYADTLEDAIAWRDILTSML